MRYPLTTFLGLSPYLRGTLEPNHQTVIRLWFIPVPTGNTRWARSKCRVRTVYPRTYGEHRNGETGCLGTDGLSPYLRGTPKSNALAIIFSRFIPVPTGNTLRTEIFSLDDPVYPRTYGEHSKYNRLF
ncbi:conserved hypothetical protein [Xenorhabdus bovienii SS-2004]|nr:conserved hypothetical protein [Xenorhabdus bovienii SS-2004]